MGQKLPQRRVLCHQLPKKVPLSISRVEGYFPTDECLYWNGGQKDMGNLTRTETEQSGNRIHKFLWCSVWSKARIYKLHHQNKVQLTYTSDEYFNGNSIQDSVPSEPID